jgi:mannose-1-phosphate guanylyltransferase
LILQTVERVLPVLPRDRIRILTGNRLAGPTLAALPHFLPEHLMLEPKAKGTAPVLVWAAHSLVQEDPESVMISLHADHHIAPAEAFRSLLMGMAARARSENLLFTVGAVPDRPETGYGYIRPGERLAGEPVAHAVARFVEKPDRATAEAYVAEGYLWNTGIFVWRAALLLEEVRRHTPEIAQHLPLLDAGDVAGFFDLVPTLNIDPAVLERSERVAVAPATFAWDDVGTWDALGRMRTPDASGNVAVGAAHFVDSSDCVAWAQDGSVVVFGGSDLLVVRVGDVTFVAPRERAEALKEMLAQLPERLREME